MSTMQLCKFETLLSLEAVQHVYSDLLKHWLWHELGVEWEVGRMVCIN